MVKDRDGADPIGSRIGLPGPSQPGQPPRPVAYTVVGVVGDGGQFRLAQETVAQIYAPLRQTPFGIAGRVLNA